jgi:hypothetical protein
LNRRWSTFMGRAGTILIAGGIALFMLSLIPPRADANTDFGETSVLQPRTFSIESSFFLSFTLNPQHGLYISAQANQSVIVYLLNVDKEYVYQWSVNHFSQNQSSYSTVNMSVLEGFLRDNPNSLAWQGRTLDEKVEFQYSPTRLMNVTLIFLNPNTEIAKVRYIGRLLIFMVPSERVLNPAKFAIPIGIALTLPQLTLWKRKNKWRLGGSESSSR